jgi:hypothetical protein
MRILKTLYLVALFSLSLGLFCGELPESMRLRDDTSNDYVNDSSASATKQLEVTQSATVPAQGQIVAIKESTVEFAIIPDSTEATPAKSGQQLLRLLSLRRT